MIQTYTGMDSAISSAEVFRDGHGLLIPWSNPTRERIEAAMAELAGYLARFPATPSFGGINQLDADRQTLWVASTGLRKPFHVHRDDLARFDGDAEGGERGIEALKQEKSVSEALKELKLVLDDALEIGVEAIGLNEDLPPELIDKLTVRYRAIRYAPVDRNVAGIGLHPDGNVLSALLTDSGGLVIKERSGVCRPPTGGTVLMPGSILYRWSNGYFKPTFHSVEIRRGDRTKFTIVAFLNFPDQTLIPRSALRHQFGFFLNDVQRHKEDDMSRAGDLAPLWSSFDKDPT
ncbi:MAG TPA: 2OG-Fe(II) oxygenase family protein [Thermoanaerobaculia bacterium]|nr:2OG-Fe(II) oxygenase family protein [Thermoanaerobaculia bacterium]